MEDLIEDILALSSDDYLKSTEETRSDYKEGKVKYLEEISPSCLCEERKLR